MYDPTVTYDLNDMDRTTWYFMRTWVQTRFLGGVSVVHIFSFYCCGVLCCCFFLLCVFAFVRCRVCPTLPVVLVCPLVIALFGFL